MTKIWTGEQFQEMGDIYLGLEEDFKFNPRIWKQKSKHCNLYNISKSFNNPSKIFCYSHRINLLNEKLQYFQNNFILITHNSDGNITNSDIVNNIVNNTKLIKWYAQNLSYDHEKIIPIPIGIANSQWDHGSQFVNFCQDQKDFNKTRKIYFNFNIGTNKEKRQECFNIVSRKLQFLSIINPYENFKRLAEYEFCICPEGNGFDTHRLWECLYLKVIPIVINSPFIQVLQKHYKLPLIILSKWEELDLDLNYNFPEIDWDSITPYND